MKRKIITFLFVFIEMSLYGQTQRVYSKEGLFDYALIENNRFYVPIRPVSHGRAAIIRMTRIDASSIAIRHICSDPDIDNLPFAWGKGKENLFSIALWRSHSTYCTDIYYRKFETRDSLVMSRLKAFEEIPEKRIHPEPLANYFRSFYGSSIRTESNEVDTIINTLSFDVFVESTHELFLYLRDSNALYIWKCSDYDSSKKGIWQEVNVYTSSKVNLNSPPLKYSPSYSGTKTISNSICDSLFFDGHFKVIPQGNEVFIINREHGYIYHVGSTAIIRIGVVELTNDYPKIQGKQLFIEDRDNNEIIFFAPVIWDEIDLPRPTVRIMTEGEIQKQLHVF